MRSAFFTVISGAVKQRYTMYTSVHDTAFEDISTITVSTKQSGKYKKTSFSAGH